jgi:hypothetical protein
VKKAVLAVLCLSMMVACERSKTEMLQKRLDNFRCILPPEVKQEFDSKNYLAAARSIDSLVQNVPDFKERYESLRHEELIDLFSPEEVVDFFREHFVEEIERLKQTKQGNW